MAAIVIALALLVGYLEVANNNGTARMELLYPAPKEPFRAEFGGPPPKPASVLVFGVPVVTDR